MTLLRMSFPVGAWRYSAALISLLRTTESGPLSSHCVATGQNHCKGRRKNARTTDGCDVTNITLRSLLRCHYLGHLAGCAGFLRSSTNRLLRFAARCATQRAFFFSAKREFMSLADAPGAFLGEFLRVSRYDGVRTVRHCEEPHAFWRIGTGSEGHPGRQENCGCDRSPR